MRTIKILVNIFLFIFLTGCGGSGGGDSKGSNEREGKDSNNDNNPPVIKVTDENIIFSHSSTAQITIEVTDPDNDAVNITWFVSEAPADSLLDIEVDASRRNALLRSSDIGNYVVRIEAFDGTDFAVETINVEVTNSKPVYTSISISQPITASSDILASLWGVRDDDNDALSYTYHWFVNDIQVEGHSDPYLESGIVERGDTVSVSAVISDGHESITTEKVSSVVENSLPYPGTLSLPESAITTDIIHASLDGTFDADKDRLSVTYQWKINGTLLQHITTSSLPANIAKKGDNVSVQATIDDGIASVVSNEVSLIISDAPAIINITNLPKESTHKSPLEFDVSITDVDEPTAKVILTYGPSGMTMDKSGHVSWTPNEVMFLKKETFHFGFQLSAKDAEIFDASVVVVDQNREKPIARSGIEVPRSNYSLWVGNFDDDAEKEILSVGKRSLIMTLAYDGTHYIQEWLYPFSLPAEGKINQVMKVDTDHNGRDEIIAISDGGISYIPDLNATASLIYKNETYSESSSYHNILSGAVGDIDNDGTMEVVFTQQNGSSSAKLLAYEIATKTEKLNINISGKPSAVVIGNVDNDRSLEIILSTGHVYDGVSGQNEWLYGSGFGTTIAVGDLDNNSIDEIIANTGGGEPTAVYSAVAKSKLWQIDDTDICTLNAANIDNDPQDELLVGNCQWGDVVVYDGATGTAVEQSRWDTVEHGSFSVTAGDINSDGKMEIIWGSGLTASGKDVLVIATQGVDQPWYNTNPSQLDSFAASGWATISPDKEEAVFIVPQTDSGYEGQRIVTMDLDGNMNLSTEIGSNWDKVYHSVVSDYNKDGYADLFLATASLYDGEFTVLQLDDFTAEYEGYGGEYENTIREIEAADLNSDGFEEAIFVDNSIVNVIDVYHQTILWSSTTFSGGIKDISMIDNHTKNPGIVVAAANEISVWRANGLSYLMESTANKSCERIEPMLSRDSNSTLIICLEMDRYNDTTPTLSLLDANLSTIWSNDLDGIVYDFTVEPSNNGEVNILASIGTNSNVSLVLISASNGKTVWRSTALPGNMYDRSLHYIPYEEGNKQVTFSTKKAMYISK